MKECITVKKIRNKAMAKKIKDRSRKSYIERNRGRIIPIPFGVYLEKIQGFSPEMVYKTMEAIK